jgi:putative MATE family efflux protein
VTDPPDPQSPGPQSAEILALAVPAFGALVAQPLFTMVDAAIVATLGTTTLAALGAGAQVFTTIVGLAIFLAYGTTAVVARRVGAGEPGTGITAGLAGVALGAGLGLLLTLLIWVAAPALVQLLGTSPSATPQAVTYLRVIALALPFALVAMAGIGVLRGLQDTATTMWVTVATVGLNAALGAWLVLRAGWGIAGSAWATVAAEAAAAAAYCFAMLSRARGYRARVRPAWLEIVAAARAAVPLFLRTAALRAVFVLAVAAAARIGDAELASYYVTFTIWYLLALGMDALAIAGQALLGRYLGAGSLRQAQAVTWQIMRWGIGLGVGLLVLVLLSRPWLVGLFGSDPVVHAMTASALVIVALQQPLAGVVFTLDGVLLGAGDNVYLAWAAGLALVLVVPALALATVGDGSVTRLWIALTWFLAVRAAALVWRIRGRQWLVAGPAR